MNFLSLSFIVPCCGVLADSAVSCSVSEIVRQESMSETKIYGSSERNLEGKRRGLCVDFVKIFSREP